MIQVPRQFDAHGLAIRIKTRREALQYTTYDVADNAELSATQINNLECDRIISPGIETLIRIAYALGTTPEWLIFGDDNYGAPTDHIGTRIIKEEN